MSERPFRLVCWNMGQAGRYSSSRAHAWRYLEELGADVALLQEVMTPPPDMQDRVAWTPTGHSRSWGSAVFARTGQVQPEAVDHTYPGQVQVAEVALRPGTGAIAVSIHAPILRNYSVTTLHKIFSDLTPLLEKRKAPIFLGGDFNAGLQWDVRQRSRTHRILFDRIEEFGLTDCLRLFHTEFVQTYRHLRGNTPWELDHVFVSNFIADQVRSCEVIDTEEARALSDHNPIVIDMTLSGMPTARPRSRKRVSQGAGQ
jgi:endonuclease/exonuclease/phosphatase family metal-dependent hydrolase